MRGELVDHRAARISQREHPGDLVVGFSGGVIASAANAPIRKSSCAVFAMRLHAVKHGVAAGNDQADGRKLHGPRSRVRFEKHSVHVPFKMVHGDERFAERHGQNLSVGDAHEQRTDEPRTLRDGDGIDFRELDAGLFHGFAHDRNDLPQMLAGGQFRYDAAIFAMNVDLRGDDARENAAASGHNGCCRFIAGRFDAQNQGFSFSQQGLPIRRAVEIDMLA